MKLNLGQIVASLGGELSGDANLVVHRIASLESATSECISFLNNPKYQQQLHSTKARCVIVSRAFLDKNPECLNQRAYIVAADSYVYFARLTQLWKRGLEQEQAALSSIQQALIHPSAVIHPSAQIHETAQIGALCVIERNAKIGANTKIYSRVTIGENCILGERCIVHSGAVIGADGFGFAPFEGRFEKIEQLGAVCIGNDVEIGANTCIDRGALGDTIIENGVKLDNLIQIAHNVRIGEHSAMAGFSGVAGSSTIGKHCTIGGRASILGHLTLADHVHISTNSVVSRSLHKPGIYTGFFPLDDNAQWEKNAVTLKQLHSLRDRIKTLEKTLVKLSA